MRILVTGGAGFIGSHLCADLLSQGHEVLCADNFLTGLRENIAALADHPRFQLLEQDVSEPFSFVADAVFHLASPASPVGYLGNPIETIKVNAIGTLHLAQAAQQQGALFLMASTSEAYGDPLVHPQTEDYWGNVNPVGPRACYDESKRLGETITMEYIRRYGLNGRIVRIFNTYGPHSRPDDGRFIPNFITQALRGQPLTIYGTGKQTRSICYVSDLVLALEKAMFTTNTSGELINLGNPEEHTVLEFAAFIAELCQASSPIQFLPPRQDDPDRRRPDISKARRILGWEPQVEMRAGLEKTIAWFKQAEERNGC